MADTSIRSNQSVLSRLARPESGRLHRKYPYRWLFEQVHVKSLIFHVEVALLAVAVIGLYHVSQISVDGDVDPLPIPGFDGHSWLWKPDYRRNIIKSFDRPHLTFAKNALNFASYFLIFSVICGFLGMRLSETSAARRNFPQHMNPALLLIPTAISVITFLYPLFLWTFRTLQTTKTILKNSNLQIYTLIDCFRMTMLPVLVIWVFYLYFLYGFCLGLMYYQRRGDQPTPTSHNNPFRRPLRKPSQHMALRLQGKASPNLLPDLTAIVTNEHSASPSHCAAPVVPSARHNRSVSPRSFRHLETVDEEAQSRSSND